MLLALHKLDCEHAESAFDASEALLDAIERGDVDSADVLYDIGDAVDAAERALGVT